MVRRITPGSLPPVNNFRVLILVSVLVLSGPVAAGETQDDLVLELSRHLDIRPEECPTDEVEEVLATGYTMICASTGLKFKDFRKQWRKAQKRLDVVDALETASWVPIQDGGMKQAFWMQDRMAIVLVNQDQVRFLTPLGAEPCGPDSPYDQPDESVVLPRWEPDARWLSGGLPLPTHRGTSVQVRARIMEDGQADVICIYDMLPKMRLFSAAAHDLVEMSRFEPALRDNAPLPWIMDVEVLFPENFNEGKAPKDDIPIWFIRSISPVPQP